MFGVYSNDVDRRPDGIGRRVGPGRGDAAGPVYASSTGAQSESLFMVGSEPAHAAALLFADRNVAVDSDQFMAQGCAWAADGAKAATARAPRTPAPRPAKLRTHVSPLMSTPMSWAATHDKRVSEGLIGRSSWSCINVWRHLTTMAPERCAGCLRSARRRSGAHWNCLRSRRAQRERERLAVRTAAQRLGGPDGLPERHGQRDRSEPGPSSSSSFVGAEAPPMGARGRPRPRRSSSRPTPRPAAPARHRRSRAGRVWSPPRRAR